LIPQGPSCVPATLVRTTIYHRTALGHDRRMKRMRKTITRTRAQKVWDLYTRCVRANDGVLFHDHGRVLKRVMRRPGEVQGVAVSTKLTLADALKSWEWVYQRTVDGHDDDQDSVDAYKEIARQIERLWDRSADDLMQQSDRVIDLLADHLLVDVPRSKPKRR
jgi:hypothetical protein